MPSEGKGQPNPKGVDHFKRVDDNLLENGIEPYVTMFHWDLPAALPGGHHHHHYHHHH